MEPVEGGFVAGLGGGVFLFFLFFVVGGFGGGFGIVAGAGAHGAGRFVPPAYGFGSGVERRVFGLFGVILAMVFGFFRFVIGANAGGRGSGMVMPPPICGDDGYGAEGGEQKCAEKGQR